jgi:hypothetical protein
MSDKELAYAEDPGGHIGSGCILSTNSSPASEFPRPGLVVVTQEHAPPSFAGLDTGRKKTLKKAQMYCPEVLRGYNPDYKSQLMVVKKNWLEVADQKHR